MALHLQKLCVGCDSIEELADWIAETLAEKRRRGMPEEQVHTTRMTPKRVEELLDGGSLYWVIRGVMQVRQRLIGLRPANAADGTPRCALVLDPELVAIEPIVRRPFQGWRYLDPADAPRDRRQTDGGGLPVHLVRELAALGLM